MTANGSVIPDLTIETLARSFFKEASGYGFAQLDYVKFVNHVLDLSMQDNARTNKLPLKQQQAASTSSANAPHDLPLHGEQIMVRALDSSRDLDTVERWMEDKEGRQFLFSRSASKLLTLGDIVSKDSSIFGMILLPDSTPIGALAFLDYDSNQQKAELRKLIGEPEHRRKGYAKEASALWLRYGTEFLGLRKIYLDTLDTNIRNVRLNESLGFHVEGILRNEVLLNGNYHDVLRMGLIHD